MAKRKIIDAVLCGLYDHKGIALREACADSGLKEGDEILVESVQGREKGKVLYVLKDLCLMEDKKNDDTPVLEALKTALWIPVDKPLKRVLARIEVKKLEEAKEEEVG